MNKIAKVITTCFVGREVRLESTAWYEHAQNLPTPEAVLKMVQHLVEKEKVVDAGLPMDTIIVNNDVGFTPGRDYLRDISGTSTKNGQIRVVEKGNYGRSFGGYDAAFRSFKDQYDHWLFTEDDMYYSKDGYAAEYLKILNENDNCAFVATIGLGRPTLETKHAHGGCGFTHKKYMEETIPMQYEVPREEGGPCFKIGGSLAHYPGESIEDNKNTRIHCLGGEVPFTYSLVRLGYDILVAEKPDQWFEFYEKG